MGQRSLRSIRRKLTKNQTAYETLRELKSYVREFGNRETARKTGLPEATIRRWIKQNRIPGRGRSLLKARTGIDLYRGSKRRVAIADTPRRFIVVQREQREAVHWAFAAGLGAPGRTENASLQVVKGESVSGVYAVPLEKIHERVLEIAQGGDTMTASNRGSDYAKPYKGSITQDGQDYLNTAFLDGIEWLLDAVGVPPAAVTSRPPDDATMRSAATVFTNDAFNCWDLYNYCRNLPGGLYYLVYADASRGALTYFEINVWVAANSELVHADEAR